MTVGLRKKERNRKELHHLLKQAHAGEIEKYPNHCFTTVLTNESLERAQRFIRPLDSFDLIPSNNKLDCDRDPPLLSSIPNPTTNITCHHYTKSYSSNPYPLNLLHWLTSIGRFMPSYSHRCHNPPYAYRCIFLIHHTSCHYSCNHQPLQPVLMRLWFDYFSSLEWLVHHEPYNMRKIWI